MLESLNYRETLEQGYKSVKLKVLLNPTKYKLNTQKYVINDEILMLLHGEHK